MTALLGIDSGLTVTKAVVYDEAGRALGEHGTRPAQLHPHAGWVERDMDELWRACAEAVRGALRDADVRPQDIAGVGVCAHGDGVYLVDGGLRPVRNGILSLDSRAAGQAQRWADDGVADRALPLVGEVPFAAAPPTLLAWLKEHEPQALERTRWVLLCKDWLRLQLTGEVATDPTEASASFVDVRTQQYTPEAPRLFGLEDVAGKMPPVVGSGEVAGRVTERAAEQTGLAAGTPVVTGLHDVTATAIGAGCLRGELCVVAGTWSINEVVADEPTLAAEWGCRTFAEPGRWLCMAASPASAGNLEWFVTRICPEAGRDAERAGGSPFDFVTSEVEEVLDDDSRVVFLPYLYGAPSGDPDASAAFVGLHGRHRRGHLLRALLEGITFNHRAHVDDLRRSFTLREARLTGGGARSPLWSQLFADVLDLPVALVDADEAGARGAAMCAGLGAGAYGSLAEAAKAAVRVERVYEPRPERRARVDDAYAEYSDVAGLLQPAWRRVEQEPSEARFSRRARGSRSPAAPPA